MKLTTLSTHRFGNLPPINKLEECGISISHVPKLAVNYLNQHWHETSLKDKFKAIPLSALIVTSSPLLLVIDAIGTLVRSIGIIINPEAKQHKILFIDAAKAQNKLQQITESYLYTISHDLDMIRNWGVANGLASLTKLGYREFESIESHNNPELNEQIPHIKCDITRFEILIEALQNEKSITLETLEIKLKEIVIIGQNIVKFIEKAKGILFPLSISIDSIPVWVDKGQFGLSNRINFTHFDTFVESLTEEQRRLVWWAYTNIYFSHQPEQLLKIVDLLKQLPVPACFTLSEELEKCKRLSFTTGEEIPKDKTLLDVYLDVYRTVEANYGFPDAAKEKVTSYKMRIDRYSKNLMHLKSVPK